MDKLIEEEVLTKRKKKRYLIGLIIVIALACCVWLIRAYLNPSISTNEFTTAKVETGNIENTINATGEVLPEFEEVLASPINASIKNVIMDAGNKVKAGQSILTLDKSQAQTDYEKLVFQIESKRNEIAKLKLDLEKSFYDIKSNNNIKQLKISNLKDMVAGAQRLFKAGGGTKEEIEQAQLNLKVAELEKQQLENEIKSKQQTMKIEIKEAEIALAIQQSDLTALKRKLDLANVVASRDGVVTWVNKNIGTSVQQGEAIARIADLSSFKVAGNMADNQLEQLHNNMPAIIRINDALLRGTVTNISPAIKNSIVSFDIRFDDKNNKLLRPNMKADVFLVTATHNNVVRVANGPAFNGSNLQDIFVITSEGKAERRSVKTGFSNFDYIEIVSGLKPGDVIITSEMSNYKHSKVLTINKS